MNAPGYEQLAAVLQAAFDQASAGKGAERHANNLPFHEQRMQGISEMLDNDAGMAFQVCKKIAESRGMSHDARERELLGAIVYTAGMVIYHRNRPSATFDSLLKKLDGHQLDARSLFLGAHAKPPEPAADIDDDSPRQQLIQQNGELAEQVYPAVDAAKEPERPRHQCQSCGLGHATHQCNAEDLPLAEVAIQQGSKPIVEPPAKPELPPTDHLVDPTGRPSWFTAPNWAMYLTQDGNGVWTWWSRRPAAIGLAWRGTGMSAEVNSGEMAGDWKLSLEAAPGLTVGKEA